MLEGLRGEDSIAELCRKEGIAQSLYYTWSKEFMEAGKRRLAGDTAPAATSGEVQDRMIAALPRTGSMAYFYRVYMQTRGMPLAIRQPAMEDEMHGVEAQMLGRLAMPNLLSGSLVGLGLVGTFIGLLQTLDELSGVFAALGGGSGSDSGAMFSTMIVKLQGPMQGMGTAFVASLYGLLGSLIIGLTVSSVKSAGERLFRATLRFF